VAVLNKSSSRNFYDVDGVFSLKSSNLPTVPNSSCNALVTMIENARKFFDTNPYLDLTPS
jgi:hypothetical protein